MKSIMNEAANEDVIDKKTGCGACTSVESQHATNRSPIRKLESG